MRYMPPRDSWNLMGDSFLKFLKINKIWTSCTSLEYITKNMGAVIWLGGITLFIYVTSTSSANTFYITLYIRTTSTTRPMWGHLVPQYKSLKKFVAFQTHLILSTSLELFLELFINRCLSSSFALGLC